MAHRQSFSWLCALAAVLLLAGAAAAEPVELTLMFRGGTLQEQLVQRWIAEFEAQNPDIKVNWRIASGDWMDQMPLWIASGTAPDVFEMWGTQARDWGENGFLLDLAPYIARDFTQEDLADFFPTSWRAAYWNGVRGKASSTASPRTATCTRSTIK